MGPSCTSTTSLKASLQVYPPLRSRGQDFSPKCVGDSIQPLMETGGTDITGQPMAWAADRLLEKVAVRLDQGLEEGWASIMKGWLLGWKESLFSCGSTSCSEQTRTPCLPRRKLSPSVCLLVALGFRGPRWCNIAHKPAS